MKTCRFSLAVAGLLAAAGVHAQLLDPSPPPLSATPSATPKSLAPGPGPFTYLYNSASGSATVFDTAFGSFRTDPKLTAGFQLTPGFAVETGYANLFSQGFHFVDDGRSDERSGALGVKGFSSYVAGKLTVPLGEQLTAHGKLGMAYSHQIAHDPAGLRVTDSDVGPYANIGARYKINDRATLSGELTRAGNTANKWGDTSNATGASASLKVGF